MLSSLKLDMCLKLNRGSDVLRKGSNWYPHRVMGNLEVSKFTAGIMKSAEKMEQLSDRFITASVGTMILFSVLLGHLHSVGLFSTMVKRNWFGFSCNTKFLDMSYTEMEKKDLVLSLF